MNEHLFTTNDGLRLITQFEGAPRLKARLCEGGAWELSYGVTFKPNGTRIQEGETCTEDEAMTLFRHALGVFEQAVRDLVTIELKPHEFSALVALCYNIGIENLRTSTVLREVNASRMYDAAAAFGMWVFATRGGYKQALRGLLRRRYAEASLLLGYDWVVATEDDAIALQREKPATLPGRDKVLYKTPFKDVLAVAQHYPLADSQIAAHAQVAVPLPYQPAPIEAPSAVNLDSPTPAPVGREIPVQLPIPEIEYEDTPAAPVAMDANEAAPETLPSPSSGRASPEISNTGSSKPASPVPVPIAPQSPPGPVSPLPPPKITPPPPPSVQVGTQSDMGGSIKNMFRSKRFWGGALIVGGRIIIALDVTGTFAAPVRAFIGDGILMDWMTGVIVTGLGEVLMARGEKNDTPLGTPKQVALYSNPPVKS